MRNLKAAGAALGDAILGGTVLDGLEEIGTDRGRHIVLFLLEAVTAGNAAAAGTGVLDVGGSHAEQIKARLADALRAQVAGGMIDQLRGVFAYVDVKLAGLDKADEELAGVLHMGDNGLMLAEFREILGILLQTVKTGTSPDETRAASVSTFRLAAARASSKKPFATIGNPQHSNSGTMTSYPAFSSMKTRSLPVCGS